MVKITLTLWGTGGKLDSKTLDVPLADHTEGSPFIRNALIAWIEAEGHLLSAGDSITITQVEN